jgi:hypothetical protein
MIKTKLTATLVALFAAASLQQVSAQPIVLTGTSYTNTFDNIESLGYPDLEWSTFTAATVTSKGTIATWGLVNSVSSSNSWRITSGRFANQASTFSYLGGTNFLGTETNNPTQWAAPNRSLAVRQVSGTDKGVAFVLKIADTLNRKDFVLGVDFLNLDPSSTRTATWTVDYGFGTDPSIFVPVATFVNPTNGFTSIRTNITFPNGTIDNNAGPVWIRIVVLAPTAGGGNRQTTGIDNFGLTWAPGVACTPVNITGQPASANGFLNGNQSFTVGAVGTAPRYYVWVKDNTTVLNDDGHFSGTTSPTLAITTLQPADAGIYTCIVSNVCEETLYSKTSSGAVLTVSSPPSATIAYLHTLVDPTTWAPTNSSLLYTATGLITTYTNTTTANTASYYLQDSTGGINLFCTFGSTFRPSIGDVVTAVGFLSSFGGNLELLCDLSNPAQGVAILSNNIAAYPAAKLIAWDNLYQGGTNANLNYNYLGSVVLLTNVYFGANAGIVTTNGNYNLVVTNAQGKIARVLLNGNQDNDLANRTIPAFAAAVRGPLVATTSGYQIMPTMWSEVVTTVPSVVLNTPVDGSTYTAPADIPLVATVTDNGYPINSVTFYNGTSPIVSKTIPPYNWPWNGIAAGNYPLTAQAAYTLFGNSLTVASGVNTVTVNQPLAPVSSMKIGLGAGGSSLNISYAGGSAAHFVLVGTNNITAPLATWPVVQTTNGTTPGTFTVPVGAASQMYYKIQSQ